MRVGFVGLGNMGKPMVMNLLKAGYEVYAYDVFEAPVKEAEAAGAVGCKSLKEVAENCTTIITMLPNSPHVKSCILGDEGLAQYAKEGTFFVDMSSIAPLASKEVAAALAEKGMRMVDAPVSGGVAGAEGGTLAIMVGGSEEDFEEAKPLFEVMGNGGMLIGPVGSGNTCKLANQIMVGVNLAAGAEALMLAKVAGADPAKVYEAIKGGSAGSFVVNARINKFLTDDYSPSFRIDLHWKDLNNVLETGYELGTPLPLTKEVQNMFNYLRGAGEGGLDHAGVMRYYEKATGVNITD